MGSIPRTGCGLLIALGVTACNSSAPKVDSLPASTPSVKADRNGEVSLPVVKWPELQPAIVAHKGKVVVVDVWAEY
jgi:hypothetical protein